MEIARGDALDALVARRDAIVAATMEALVPGYPRRRRVPDLEGGIADAFDAIVACVSERRRLTEDDLFFLPAVVRNAALRGGSEAEILRAPLVFQRVLWNTMVESVGATGDGRAAILALTETVLDYVDVASRVTHAIHLEVSEALNAMSSVARFELAERLLAGSLPEPGVPAGLARRYGLAERSPVLVVVARAVPEDPSMTEGRELVLPMALRTLARAAAGGGVEPLAVVRDDELVIVRTTQESETDALVAALENARRQLEDTGPTLLVGASTVHDELAKVPTAYDEACLALESLGERPGLVALAALRPLDYLVLRAGRATAWRLVPADIRTFVTTALVEERALLDTLRAYVECDLNVKRTAERLYLHPNTVHYRLDRVAERTGCNLRSFADLEQLMIAVKLGVGIPAS